MSFEFLSIYGVFIVVGVLVRLIILVLSLIILDVLGCVVCLFGMLFLKDKYVFLLLLIKIVGLKS